MYALQETEYPTPLDSNTDFHDATKENPDASKVALVRIKHCSETDTVWLGFLKVRSAFSVGCACLLMTCHTYDTCCVPVYVQYSFSLAGGPSIYYEEFDPDLANHRKFVSFFAYMYMCGPGAPGCVDTAHSGLQDGAKWTCKPLFEVIDQLPHSSRDPALHYNTSVLCAIAVSTSRIQASGRAPAAPAPAPAAPAAPARA